MKKLLRRKAVHISVIVAFETASTTSTLFATAKPTLQALQLVLHCSVSLTSTGCVSRLDSSYTRDTSELPVGTLEQRCYKLVLTQALEASLVLANASFTLTW